MDPRSREVLEWPLPQDNSVLRSSLDDAILQRPLDDSGQARLPPNQDSFSFGQGTIGSSIQRQQLTRPQTKAYYAVKCLLKPRAGSYQAQALARYAIFFDTCQWIELFADRVDYAGN